MTLTVHIPNKHTYADTDIPCHQNNSYIHVHHASDLIVQTILYHNKVWHLHIPDTDCLFTFADLETCFMSTSNVILKHWRIMKHCHKWTYLYPGHIFADNATEELRSNRSRITTEMSNSVVRYGSSTETQRYEYGVRRIYRQNVDKSPGRDTDCYGPTRFDTERHESGRTQYGYTTVCYGTSGYG